MNADHQPRYVKIVYIRRREKIPAVNQAETNCFPALFICFRSYQPDKRIELMAAAPPETVHRLKAVPERLQLRCSLPCPGAAQTKHPVIFVRIINR